MLGVRRAGGVIRSAAVRVRVRVVHQPDTPWRGRMQVGVHGPRAGRPTLATGRNALTHPGEYGHFVQVLLALISANQRSDVKVCYYL